MTIRKLLNYWFMKKRDGFYLFLTLLLAAAYVAGILTENYGYDSWAAILKSASFIGFLFLAVIILIHSNLHAIHEFLKLFHNQDHFPQKQIEHVNSFCMTVFLGITLFFMAGFSLLLEPLWPVIRQWFASLKHPVQPQPPVPEEICPAFSKVVDFSALFGEPAPPPAWMKIVDRLFSFIGYVLIIAIALFLLRTMCLSIWNWITSPRQFDDDEKIYLKPTLSMSGEKASAPREKEFFYFLSYNGKIRRYYRKKILIQQKKQKKSVPPAWATPAELEKVSGIEDQILHQVYEKARYSRQGGKESDWKCISGRQR